jgi:hypothetical protein
MSDEQGQPPGELDESQSARRLVPPDQLFALPSPGMSSPELPPSGWDMPTGAPAPGPADRRTWLRTNRLWLAVALLLAFGTGAVSFAAGVHQARVAAATTAQSQPDRSCSRASPPAAVGAALLAQMLPTPPGATALSGDAAPGVLPFGKLVNALYPDGPNVTPVLTALCIEFMAYSGWQTPAEQVFIYLVQTGSPVDAEGFEVFSATLLSRVSNGIHGALPGGLYYVKEAVNGSRAEVQEFGPKGSVFVLVTVLTPKFDPESPAMFLLRDQQARLPK